ncbi:MAG: hypothetical protein ABJP86_08835 [Flavobacteriaceae bacterium]
MHTKYYLQALTVSLLVFFNAKSQEGDPKSPDEKTLIEYLTVVQLDTETTIINEYCNCVDKSMLIKKYQNVAIEFNKTINMHLSELSILKAREAIDYFNNINDNYKDYKEWKSWESPHKTYLKFKGYSCPPRNKGFLPAAVTIAEITGIANSIIGLINEGKKRRDAQRDKLIALLETFKIPSVQGYIQTIKCSEENKLDKAGSNKENKKKKNKVKN